MTNKKLTDNEIIKALKCCTTNGASCKNCPAFVKVDRSNCKKYFRGALDLINRQKAEIDELQLEIKSYNAENNKLKAENSNLTSDLTSLQNDLTSAKAEIERLTIRLRKVEHQLDDAMKMYNTIKAEAYKEFAENAVERVEKAKLKYQRLCKEQGEEMEEHMHTHFNGIIGIIKNLLKELMGDAELPSE